MSEATIKKAFEVDGSHGHDSLMRVLPTGKGHGNAGERVEKVLKC